MISQYNEEIKPEDFYHVEYDESLEYKIPQELIDQAVTDPKGSNYSITINWDKEYPLLYPGVINNMFTITNVYEDESFKDYPLVLDELGHWVGVSISKKVDENIYQDVVSSKPKVEINFTLDLQNNVSVITVDVASYYKYDYTNKKIILSSEKREGFKQGLPTPLYPEDYETDQMYIKSGAYNPFYFSMDLPLETMHPIFGEDGRYYFEDANGK